MANCAAAEPIRSCGENSTPAVGRVLTGRLDLDPHGTAENPFPTGRSRTVRAMDR